MKTAPVGIFFNVQSFKNLYKKSISMVDDSIKKENTAPLPNALNFLGTYYAQTDAHARVPMVASTLCGIENSIENDKSPEPVFCWIAEIFSEKVMLLKQLEMFILLFKKEILMLRLFLLLETMILKVQS